LKDVKHSVYFTEYTKKDVQLHIDYIDYTFVRKVSKDNINFKIIITLYFQKSHHSSLKKKQKKKKKKSRTLRTHDSGREQKRTRMMMSSGLIGGQDDANDVSPSGKLMLKYGAG